jgi:hypothetical protein
MPAALNAWVEAQLIHDLRHYEIHQPALHIDWSQSYGSGRQAKFLDGKVQNFSRIIVFDENKTLVADGCMDFICNKFFGICYWDLVTTWKNDRILREKKETGVPFHIWRQLPVTMMSKYIPQRLRNAS